MARLQVCAARKHSGHTEADHTFSLPYDILLCAVRRSRAPCLAAARLHGAPLRAAEQPACFPPRTCPYLPSILPQCGQACKQCRPPPSSPNPCPQVGAVNATFGIPGVTEHCWFLKSMEDATRLRRHIRQARLASLPVPASWRIK